MPHYAAYDTRALAPASMHPLPQGSWKPTYGSCVWVDEAEAKVLAQGAGACERTDSC